MRWPFRTQRHQNTEHCRPPEGFVEAQFVGFADFPQEKREHATMDVKDDPLHMKVGTRSSTRTGANTHHGHTRYPPRRVACVQNEANPASPRKPSHAPLLPPVASEKTPPMHCITNISNLKPPPPSAPPAPQTNCNDRTSNELNSTLSPWRRRSIVTLAGADELERYQRSHHLGSLNSDEPSSLERRSHSLPMDRVTQPMGSSLETTSMNQSSRSCPGKVRSAKPKETTLEQRAHAYRASCQMKPAPLSSVGHRHQDYPPTISLHWSISQANQPNTM